MLIPKNPKAVVQFNCGTATNTRFYMRFLQYLVEHDYLCCLWDYRGSGESAPADLRNCNYWYADYGLKDIPAIKRFLRAEYPDLPFLFIGHSTGGQQIGFLNELDDVCGAVLFAVSAGYYPNMPLAYRIKAYFFFYLFAPVSIKLKGYVAAKRFGLMEDLPKNVVMQWRRWLEKPNYFFDEKYFGREVPNHTYQSIPFPVRVYFSSDDTISSPKNIENFWLNTKVNDLLIEELDVKLLPVKKIDHFGYFRSELKEILWVRVLSELDKMVYMYRSGH